MSTILSTEPICGVYMLFLDGELVYVGRSENCPERVRQHRQNNRQFDSHLIAPCEVDDAAWMEGAIVRATEAAQNRILFSTKRRRPLPPRPTVDPGEHPAMLLNKTAARARAARFGLAAAFERAVRAGDLEMHAAPGRVAREGGPRYIAVGTLLQWCEWEQANLLIAAA